MEYDLTEFGQSLEPVLLAMRAWGQAFQARMDAAETEPRGGPAQPRSICIGAG